MVAEQSNPDNDPIKNDAVIEIDLGKLYAFEASDMVPDITVSRYSNVAYIVCTHRDVYIDFLEMPGVKKDGKMMVNGTRIFMGHAAAQRLAEALKGILEKVYDEKGMEAYAPEGPRKKSSQTSQIPAEKKRSTTVKL